MDLCLQYPYSSTALIPLASMPSSFERVQIGSWFWFLQNYMLCLAFQIEITMRSDFILVKFDRCLLLRIDVVQRGIEP